ETRTMLAADKHSVARAQVKSAKIRCAVRKHKVTATPKAKPTRQRS
ncbi:MAG: 23S rRNA pseudouridine(2605) synthase RluB, partial [Shewanella sp.]